MAAKPRKARPTPAGPATAPVAILAPKPVPVVARWTGAWLADACLIVAFLALTFLLGVFPLKDTDFWWHLRTGDLLRAGADFPRTDWYTFTAANHTWVDLHWGFQVAISWLHARGGVEALTLAKCGITCLGMLVLVTARRRDWPVWTILLAWLPALLVLAGRMYIRPETLTFLFLAADLAILFRWRERPKLAYLLPIVQLFWVNTHGLFVLGPVAIAFALAEAVLNPARLLPDRGRWWRTVGPALGLTGLACVLNPYGLLGALYPIQLARTMGNPIFSETIAELTPLPQFIASAGFGNLPLRLHLITLAVGALSFLLPIAWAVSARIADRKLPVPDPRKRRSKAGPGRPGWPLSPFRLLLFLSFSALSWRATRNSHQFAAVVGTLTAWNFAEWAAAVVARRGATGRAPGWLVGVVPRVATFGAIAAVFVAVASGSYYAWTKEGRTIGLGEEPLWFAHEAVAFAGRPGMPDRMLGFHNGIPALYAYHHGPERKIFADARLEVIGLDLYERYLAIEKGIGSDEPGWARELDAMGRPLIIVDNLGPGFANIFATLLASPGYRCVYYNAIASVFVHESTLEPAKVRPVDFAARHFRPDPPGRPKGRAASLATARALRHDALALYLKGRPDLARPLIALGMDCARRAIEAGPGLADGWKVAGQLEEARDPEPPSLPRFRLPFDPAYDLEPVRLTYLFRKSLELAPDDFAAILSLVRTFKARGMNEEVVPLLERLADLPTINQEQVRIQSSLGEARAGFQAAIGTPAAGPWRNLSELESMVADLLNRGRARSAAEILEAAYSRPEARTWEVADRIATLLIHLGEPDRARTHWESAPDGPTPGLRLARIALADLVAGQVDAARRGYREALAVAPTLYEAHFGLATLEQDAGRAAEALTEARLANNHAPAADAVGKAAARAIEAFVEPYAGPTTP